MTTVLVARISNNCAEGYDVKVIPSSGLEMTAVARDHQGRITALALAHKRRMTQGITVYVYKNGFLAGVIAT